MKHRNFISEADWKIMHLALLIALVSVFGSLFFSEVMKLPPCVLCWYQRIAMFPIVPILILGIILQNNLVAIYVLSLSIPGFMVAVYHNLLYYGVIPERLSPCIQGISCTTRQLEWLGFISIPLLTLVAFALITILMTFFLKSHKFYGVYK